ncbi:hypothetical protein EZV62_013436 [Acer yangbiense]|uniref:SLC26A/SulP transporter domain-containing protein n=1 Tax=Acer yangbiense TaxID=1000413 RepID=A0A5C7HY71_9ROSI|nr:hypothetical protein EZV62_013436 [Acer yangbiense]
MESQNDQTPPHQTTQISPTETRHNMPTTSSNSPAEIMDKVKNNLVLRSKWAEVNGAIGDLGTYIPIVLALALAKDLNLGTTLIFTGVYNIVTGVYNIVTGAIYGVPMPVQPMKSIATVAISDGSDFGIPEMMAAGICTGGILLVLGVTGLMQLAYKLIHLPVVRGIQVSQGLAFVMPKLVKDFQFGPSSIGFVNISKNSWKQGFLKGTIPQLPLSVLNSVIAVCKLSSDLFPGKDFLATSVSMTVGLMNLMGCWFGAMPCYHGAGGQAGQYKFGGRSGGCVALLGAAKMVLGLVLRSSLVMVLDQFPVGVLGVLLLFARFELAMACRDMNSKEQSFVMLICTAVSLVGSSAALGFVCGMVVHLLLKLKSCTKDEACSTSIPCMRA